MNPQAFRQKLETALLDQDQQTLAELGHVAAEHPLTAQIWQKHLQVEQAIQAWSQNSAVRLSQPISTVAPLPAQIKKPAQYRWQPLLALLILCTCGVGLFWNPQQPIPVENLVEQTTPALPSEESPLQLTEETEEPSPLIDVSLAIVAQGRDLLDPALIPLLPEMTSQLEASMKGTWETLSALPVGMQQAWQGMGTQASEADHLSPADQQGLSNEESLPAQRPMRKSRRARPSRPPAMEADRDSGHLPVLA